LREARFVLYPIRLLKPLRWSRCYADARLIEPLLRLCGARSRGYAQKERLWRPILIS
jgi:hypothetical protein